MTTGTFSSNANSPVSNLPKELVINILSNLSVSDLVSCHRVNRYLNDIIDGSQQLQHHIDTAVAGVVDNPNSFLSLLERRHALARRQHAWDTFQPQRTVTSEAILWEDRHCNSPTDLQLDRTWLHIDPLREDGYHVIKNIAGCPDHNEIAAIGMQCADVPFHSSGFNKYSFEVDILSFSETTGGRPWTRKSTVHVKDSMNDKHIIWEMKIEIHTNLLAVLFIPFFTGHGPRAEDELWVFDWKTRERIACLKGQGISAFRFLSSSVILVGSVSPESTSTAAFELFDVRIANGSLCSTSIKKVATLGLPFVDEDCFIYHLEFHPLFVKNLVHREKGLFFDMSMDTNPFISAKSDNIIFVRFGTKSRGSDPDSVSLIVHSSTLLRHVTPSPSKGNMPHRVPWECWGPTATRWYGGRILVGGGPIICGYRFLLQGHCEWQIWDFNPFRVKRLGKDFAVHNDTSYLTVVTEESWAAPRGRSKGVPSSLPFVKLVQRRWGNRYKGLYEHKIIGEKYLDDDHYVVETLYFG